MDNIFHRDWVKDGWCVRAARRAGEKLAAGLNWPQPGAQGDEDSKRGTSSDGTRGLELLADSDNAVVGLRGGARLVPPQRAEIVELQHRLTMLEKEAADLRAQRDELDVRAQAAAQALASALHEMRTPLVAVRGYARMILEDGPGCADDDVRAYLGVIRENTERVLTVLNRLSNSSLVEPRRMERFDFRLLWLETLAALRPQASEKSIALTEHLPDHPIPISGVRDRMAFVLHMLLANAVKFSAPGGEIEVEVLAGADHVAARICDTNGAIPPYLFGKAFGSQADDETRAGAGQNTRVSLIHDIVRMHEGRILTTNGTGEGWTLTLVLPAKA